MGRPLAMMSVVGGDVAVKMYLEYVKQDIIRAMTLTGCDNLNDASMNILARYE